ncbi:MAG TPA: ubiquitin-like domain-containing protein [Candidatus Deferrimicrobium sp.]|nr:ubiquitin-like domain-containing protein [Candidatus Deferrimicrobium sp.]
MFEDEFDEELEEPEEKKPPMKSKTPAKKPSTARGDNISVFFQSTIGPGEKKEKLMVNTGNQVGDIKTTVGNLFGLSPEDFHLSYGGVTMEETNPLSDYNLNNGDTVLLIPASTAG